MKAAILVEQNKPLSLADISTPELGVGQILVKMAYSGICGKQIEEINGKRGHDPYLPHLLGHEGSGVVKKIGLGVRKVNPGDQVVLHWMKGSGIDSQPPRFEWNGNIVSAGWVTTFSEYTVVSENRVTRIDKDMPLDVACLLGCAVTTGLGVVLNDAALNPGQSIAIFGVGGVGVNVIQGATLVNSHPIVGVDIIDSKLKKALEFGASHTVNSTNANVVDQLKDISGEDGFDVTVDVTGNNLVRQLAYNSASDTGMTIFAGVPELNDKISIDSFPLHFGKRLIGSHGGATNPDRDIPRYVKLYQLGRLKLKEQVTHRFAIDSINEAVALVQNGEVGRCLISF